MKKVALMVIATLALMTFAGVGGTIAAQQRSEVMLNMMEQNDSGQSGTVTFREVREGTEVIIELDNSPANVEQPAHFHAGSCADLDPEPLAPLQDVVNGVSENLIGATIPQVFEIADQVGLAINVHKSYEEADIYVSCGDITQDNIIEGGTSGGGMMPGGMPTTGNGSSTLPVIALALVAVALMGTGLKLARRKV